MDQTVRGHLHAWLRTRDGQWLGYVSYLMMGPTGVGALRMQHTVPADAVYPRRPGDRTSPR
ncbi:hypothetical protein GCM10010174_26080 [Kutzneria viridogrisea]|uniref:Uncharacterized protein n=1 Tax=Kutzneria viridogrisea TaxID=47990 RepID=A0ABR6BRJ2_9PSEU|nr:hypothetical protein [Kutzneria viridogrisea]